ncbi:hypothetical protein [Belliella aquatica]|uniref:Transposase n=1 Tax=Belliella aquatica TaxID=1323734 RepID=A0ABQ1N4D2_9BACT|nr:hypothetical protein [Belliella aquatica]MCH7407392.1 hypothetical protein [Belliella aquatica]GGC53267.1 hypothetical protein GCM10010993_34670 [Belliella aquatica]
MERTYYDQKIKDEAVRRFFAGEPSPKIAEDMNIPSADLIRKWVQLKRKELNLPPNYRESTYVEKGDEVIRLRSVIARLEVERDTVLKTLTLVTTGEIDGWDTLKTHFIDLRNN